MKSATRRLVSTLGVLAGLMGIEHGVGEILQGNAAPQGLVIASWPDSEFFRALAGEPAMTVVPNLLVSGVLAVFWSLVFLVWVVRYLDRRRAGLVMVLLSVVMLLVGAGFGPPLLGMILGVTASRVPAPGSGRRGGQPGAVRRFLSALWPCSFAVCMAAWLLVFPGSVVLDFFFGINYETLTYALILSAFGSLGLAIAAGLARDGMRPAARPAARAPAEALA